LIDLEMDALGGIKSDPELKQVPVVMVASDDSDETMASAYDAYVNAYVVRPSDPIEMEDTIERLLRFWLVSILPPKKN